jgi:hypothetical protein
MNNLFKFRVWNTRTNKYYFNDTTASECFDIWSWTDRMSDCLGYPINHCVFQLWTGLKDTKNKNIYDGDIIKDVVGGFNTVVFWDNKGASWVAGLGFFDGHQFVPTVISDSPSCGRRKIVIGNIFENFSLIKS